MSTAITQISPANLAGALTAAVNTAIGGDRLPLLRMNKGGAWELRHSAEDVETLNTGEVSIVINPLSFVHGWMAFSDTNIVLARDVVSIFQPLPAPPSLPEGAKKPAQYYGVDVVILFADGERVQAHLSTMSYGGKKMFAALMKAVAEQAGVDPVKTYPTVKLANTSYVRPAQAGSPQVRVYEPIASVQPTAWLSVGDMDSMVAELDAEDEPKAALPAPPPPPPAAVAATPRRRRPAA
jgi:hypothetical protein